MANDRYASSSQFDPVTICYSEIELTGLCITFQQCQSDQLLGLHNIGVIRDFSLDPKRQIQKRLMLMSVACSSFGCYSSVEHHSRYSSSLLVDFICDLSEHATRYIHDERGQIHMKHRASPGTLLDMHIAIPEANGSTSQYIAVIRRQREQSESLPTLTELYSLFSSAAMFKKTKDTCASYKGAVIHRLFLLGTSTLCNSTLIIHNVDSRKEGSYRRQYGNQRVAVVQPTFSSRL